MHPTVTKEEVVRLATTMGYKYKDRSSQTGGCKAGIAYDYKAPDALDVLGRFLTHRSGLSTCKFPSAEIRVDLPDVLRILDDLGRCSANKSHGANRISIRVL